MLNKFAVTEDWYTDQLSAAIDSLTAAGINADGNIDRLSDNGPDASHESRVDLVLRLSGYDPRRDLAEKLAECLLAVWGPDNAWLLLRDVASREKVA